MFPHYRQLDQKDCGPTCLKIVAKYYGKRLDIQYLRDLCNVTREGVSFNSLSSAADTVGLRAMVFRISFDQLLHKLTVPCILHWNNQHFVVLYKIGKKKIWVSDPARARIAYTHEEFKKHWLDDSREKLGVVMALEPQVSFDTKHERDDNKSKSVYIHNVLKYLKRYKKELGQLAIIMLVITLMQGVLPFVFRAIIDVGIGRNDEDFIDIILVANVTLIVSIAIANFIRDWINKQIGARFSLNLISDYLVKLMKMPAQYFEARMTSDLLYKLRDHERVKNFILNQSVNAVFALLSFTVFSIILFSFNVTLFYIFVTGTAIYMLWIVLFMRFEEKLDWDQHKLSMQNQTYWTETMSAIHEIKVHNLEQKRRWQWESIQASLYNVGQKQMRITHLQSVGSQLINGLKNVAMTFFSAKSVLAGDMTLGVMISLQFIIGFLNTPTAQLVAFIQSFTPARISFLRLNDIHSYKDEEANQPTASIPLPEDKSIYLRNVSFRYSSEDDFSLRNISLVIPQHSVTAIVGLSGSGKSTLLKLLLRLYKATDGDILVGNTNMRNVNVKYWRSHCAAVLQDGKIFDDTLLNNIVLGEDQVDYNKLVKVVELAQCKELVDSLALGYSTRIGPKGRDLSQGQKQRILIARALYRDPQYLFLDEATNALDSFNEQKILINFNEVFKQRTVVVAAHRLSTIKRADLIIVLEKGAVVGMGTHAQLLENNVFYRRLVVNQGVPVKKLHQPQIEKNGSRVG